MKAAVYITPLIALAAAPVAAELDTMTIQNLPLSAEENRLVCYDSASGKLGNCPGRETSISVDCNLPAASITDAIEKATTAAGVALTVNISGTCNETLEIERPNTLLLGDGTATIVAQKTSLGAITVITGPVEMENLVVAGGTGPGITVWPGGSLFLNDVTITSEKTALSAFGGKAVLIQGNDVSSSGTDNHAVVARDGGSVYMGSNNTLSSPTTFASTNATLGIYRGSSVTVQGDGNQISNTDPGLDSLALKLTQGAHFRQEKGHSVLNGGVRIINMSSADFRDVEIEGDIFAKIFASLHFEDQDSDGVPTDTVVGNISIGHLANIDIKGSVRLEGNLSCSPAGTGSGSTPTVTGSDTCYP